MKLTRSFVWTLALMGTSLTSQAQVTDLSPAGERVEFLAASPVQAGTVLAISGLWIFGGVEVLRSVDGGKTFSRQFLGVAHSPRGLVFDGGSSAYACTQDSIWSSDDQGSTWTDMPAQPNGPFHAFEAIGASVRGAAGHLWVLYDTSSTIDSDVGLARSLDGGATWNVVRLFDGSFLPQTIAVDPVDSNRVALGASGGFLDITNDGGQTWVRNYATDFRSALSILRCGPTISRLTYDGIWSTIDDGVTWSQVLPSSATTDIGNLVEDASRPGRWLAYMEHDGLFESLDCGATWAQLLAGPLIAGVLNVAAGPGSTEEIYLGTELMGLLRALPGEDAYGLAEEGLDLAQSRALAIDETNRDHLVTRPVWRFWNPGESASLVESFDGGATWQAVSLPYRTWVEGFRFDAQGRLYVFGQMNSASERTMALARRDSNGWTQLIAPGVLAPDFSSMTDLAVSLAEPGLMAAARRVDPSSVTVDLIVSEDGGATWSVRSDPVEPTSQAIEQLQFLDGTDGPRLLWTADVGPSHVVRYSDDRGLTCTTQVLTGAGAYDMFLTHSRGTVRRVILGFDGDRRLFLSDNGFTTHAPVGEFRRGNQVAVGSRNPDLWFRIGLFDESPILARTLFQSNDGGATWSHVPSSPLFHHDPGRAAMLLAKDDSALFMYSHEGLFRLDLAPPVGVEHCGPAVSNSAARSSTIAALGSTSLQMSDLRLFVDQMPKDQATMFLASRQPGFIPGAGGSAGNLCLSGAIGRYSNDIRLSNAVGELDLFIDAGAIAQPNGTTAAIAGEQWFFQAWHRDTVQGTATSNFTNAVGVTWTP